jgi:hypothetical protein
MVNFVVVMLVIIAAGNLIKKILLDLEIILIAWSLNYPTGQVVAITFEDPERI